MAMDDVLALILRYSRRMVERAAKLERKRELYGIISKALSNTSIAIYGLRGVGKTTLLLQLAHEEGGVYIDLSSSYMLGEDLLPIAERLMEMGYNTLYLDEVHLLPRWPYVVKTIIDQLSLRVAISGSSTIALQRGSIGADLARRMAFFHLPPLSFREWLSLRYGITLPPLSLKETLVWKDKTRYWEHHNKLSLYLQQGGLLYPPGELFGEMVRNTLLRVVEWDLSTEGVSVEVRHNLHRLLRMVAQFPAYEVTKEVIAEALHVGWREVERYLILLTKAGLLLPVEPCGVVRKATPRLYLPIPYRSALGGELRGMREDFFVHHFHYAQLPLCYPKGMRRSPDFVHDNIIFEVGGRRESWQKAHYRVVDSLTFGPKDVPLVMFGYLY